MATKEFTGENRFDDYLFWAQSRKRKNPQFQVLLTRTGVRHTDGTMKLVIEYRAPRRTT